MYRKTQSNHVMSFKEKNKYGNFLALSAASGGTLLVKGGPKRKKKQQNESLVLVYVTNIGCLSLASDTSLYIRAIRLFR